MRSQAVYSARSLSNVARASGLAARAISQCSESRQVGAKAGGRGDHGSARRELGARRAWALGLTTTP